MMYSVIHSTPVLLDPKKGSFTNRVDCAKETFKNDLKYVLSLTVPAAACTTAAIVKPGIFTKTATALGNAAGKVFSKLGSKLGSTGVKTAQLAQKILKNPAKFGKLGLIAAGALYLADRICKHEYKAGQIDQKYTDSAAVETQTKRVVLG